MRNWMPVLLSIFYINMAFAAAIDQAFQDGLRTGTTHQNVAHFAMNHFDPNATFKAYTDHPKEGDYYKGGTDIDTPLKEDAIHALPESVVGSAIQESVKNRPEFSVDPNSPEMQKSKLIQNNAVDIVNGVSNDYVDCNKEQTCTTTYETKVCEESPKTLNQYCKKILNIDMVPHQTDVHHILNIHLSASQHGYAGAVVNAITGKVNYKGPSEASLTFSGRLPQGTDCKSLHGTYIITGTQHHTVVDSIELPNCSNGLVVNLHMSGKDDKANLSLQIDMVSSNVELEAKDRLEDQCMGLANNALCTFQGERCIEANTTHTIQGVPVTRVCWEMEREYLCRGSGTDNACQPLRNQGCEQTGSVCKSRNDGGCTLYSQTFRCPVKNCVDTSVICNGETYCLTEDCMAHSRTADPDFQKAATSLSAVHDASKEFDEQSIFTGSAKSCQSDIIHFRNCCADDGWGIDMNLAECTQEEKELGEAKKNKQTIYVGNYCDTDVLGVCLQHRKAYCVFPSLLGRIVQQQGRGGQLKISFGKPEYPTCRGITPEELQSINFDLIDFSDFYSDLSAKERLEDPALISKRIKDNINHSVGEGA